MVIIHSKALANLQAGSIPRDNSSSVDRRVRTRVAYLFHDLRSQSKALNYLQHDPNGQPYLITCSHHLMTRIQEFIQHVSFQYESASMARKWASVTAVVHAQFCQRFRGTLPRDSHGHD